MHISPWCFSTSHLAAQGKPAQQTMQHLNNPPPPAQTAGAVLSSSFISPWIYQEQLQAKEKPKAAVTPEILGLGSPSPPSHPTAHQAFQLLPLLTGHSRHVYVRFSKHHGQGVLLYF